MEKNYMFRQYIQLSGNLLAIQDNYPKIVVTMDEIEGVSYQGIEQTPIRQFLLCWKQFFY